MSGNVATVGSDKIGFAVIGHEPDGTPLYIGGTRGVVERNTMRYYLALKRGQAHRAPVDGQTCTCFAINLGTTMNLRTGLTPLTRLWVRRR